VSTRDPSSVTATGICFVSEAIVLWPVGAVLHELFGERYHRERGRVRPWSVRLWVVAAVVLLLQAALLQSCWSSLPRGVIFARLVVQWAKLPRRIEAAR